MNKIFFLSAAAVLTVLLAGCSKGEAPDGLGKVSFASSRTWVIDGAGITQTWSDVVVASATLIMTHPPMLLRPIGAIIRVIRAPSFLGRR